jgi:hypothetical protein
MFIFKDQNKESCAAGNNANPFADEETDNEWWNTNLTK